MWYLQEYFKSPALCHQLQMHQQSWYLVYRIKFKSFTFRTYVALVSFPIYVDDTTLYSKCDQVSGLSQQLEFFCDFQGNLRPRQQPLLKVSGVTYVETQFNHSKFCNFISW